MKDYWDYSEKERSELCEEEVTALLAIELMKNGLMFPQRQKLSPVRDVELKTVTTWHIKFDGRYSADTSNVGFYSKEAAESAVALGMFGVTSEWNEDHQTIRAITGVVPKDNAISKADSESLASVLKANKLARDENEKREKAYNDDVSKCERATKGIWDDWYRCRDVGRRVESVIRTFSEYMKLTEANANLARTFLKEAFNYEELETAESWSGENLTTNTPECVSDSQEVCP